MSRILIVTDAWAPQVNGVVRSLENLLREAPRQGAEIRMLTPASFRTVPLPTYRELRIAFTRPGVIAARIREEAPDYVHIATEGPLGICARMACLRSGRPFTTSYHTRFPEYLAARHLAPRDLTYALMRRFHNSSAGVMVATESVERELAGRGFRRLMRWSRGVDADLFRPRERSVLDLPQPIFLTCGRLAIEKNLEAFLSLDLPGSKVVVGDGPARKSLEARFPRAHFLGLLQGEALASAYAAADVFVFPSLTDTFGIVLLEAMACGAPVAAFPVAGPLDIIGDSGAGVLDRDLAKAALAALEIPRDRARDHAVTFSWSACARQFIDNVERAHARAAAQSMGAAHPARV
ncbi:MAG: glycosyltransferase family 1 protein [Alphaproteobacteria bacterium]|nr:glycosyltransferase family 1 protein [Alphaproteobacteria bacterium]